MKKSAVARRAGKYTKYTAAIILDMLRHNWSQTDIAAALQVTPRTLSRWVQQHEEVALAQLEATRPREAEVESAILELAQGAVSEKVVERFDIDPETRQLIPVAREVTTVQEKPDLKAGIFWLKNRRPEAWQDRQEHDVRSLGITLNIDAKDAEL